VIFFLSNNYTLDRHPLVEKRKKVVHRYILMSDLCVIYDLDKHLVD